ncbi:MAG: BufA2 family periplasmic bufferin-type metallophore [Pyrinomonadaceae bacterium]
MNVKKITGAAVALAAASMFVGAGITTTFAAEGGKVECVGGNACKGKSECKTANNACKGQNACKGTGKTAAADEKACEAAKAANKKS